MDWLSILRLLPALLIVLALGFQTWRLESATSELNQIKAATKQAQEQSDATIEILRRSFTPVVEQAKRDAVVNYQKRFPPVSCPRPDSLLSAGSGQAERAEGTDGVEEPERLAFVEACAADITIIRAWQEWAMRNNMPVK